MNRLSSLYIFLLIGVLPVFCDTASAQLGQLVGLEVSQQPDADGVLQYEVSATGSFSSGSGLLNLVAPDGTSFGVSNNSVGGLDLQQVGDRFFGDWNLVSDVFGISSPAFTLNPFGLDDVFSEVPTFISPLSSGTSATVLGASFLLDWEYPSGFDGFSGRTFQARSSGSSLDIQFGDPTSLNVSLTTESGPLMVTDILFTAGNRTRFDDFASPAEGSDLSVTASFLTLTQPFSVTVVPVPEPGTGVIFSAAAAIYAFVRRKKVGTKR